MAAPEPLPWGTAAGWYSDPVDVSRRRFWDGTSWTAETSTAESPSIPATFTTEDYLRAIGSHVKAIRSSVAVVAIVAGIQLLFIALWLLGAITVEFDDGGF